VRLKLDENLPRRVERLLVSLGHDCSTAVGEGLGGARDASVAAAAAGEGRVLVTLDRGFGDIRAYPPGSHPGILIIHSLDQAPRTLADLLNSFLAERDLRAFEGCLVILETSRVRVRRPPVGG